MIVSVYRRDGIAGGIIGVLDRHQIGGIATPATSTYSMRLSLSIIALIHLLMHNLRVRLIMIDIIGSIHLVGIFLRHPCVTDHDGVIAIELADELCSARVGLGSS